MTNVYRKGDDYRVAGSPADGVKLTYDGYQPVDGVPSGVPVVDAGSTQDDGEVGGQLKQSEPDQSVDTEGEPSDDYRY